MDNDIEYILYLIKDVHSEEHGWSVSKPEITLNSIIKSLHLKSFNKI